MTFSILKKQYKLIAQVPIELLVAYLCDDELEVLKIDYIGLVARLDSHFLYFTVFLTAKATH
jgi:hypothetical protein